ncbi:alpha-L-rhamnosidase N-terminal domain-containing protein, partial [Flavobacterium circumlabens]
NNEYDGEDYDARRELKGWNTIDYNDKNWLTAEYVQEPGGFYEAQMTPNMKIIDEVKPVSIKQTP